MRELDNDKDLELWKIMYVASTWTPDDFYIEPFDPGRLHIETIKQSRTVEEIINMFKIFTETLQKRDIDFEKHLVMKKSPEIKNQHVYLYLEKYIDYLKQNLTYLNDLV